MTSIKESTADIAQILKYLHDPHTEITEVSPYSPYIGRFISYISYDIIRYMPVVFPLQICVFVSFQVTSRQ
jgi:hypothetical protein